MNGGIWVQWSSGWTKGTYNRSDRCWQDPRETTMLWPSYLQHDSRFKGCCIKVILVKVVMVTNGVFLEEQGPSCQSGLSVGFLAS